MVVHVITATDSDGKVCDQKVFFDYDSAKCVFEKFKKTYGGRFVCLAERPVWMRDQSLRIISLLS